MAGIATAALITAVGAGLLSGSVASAQSPAAERGEVMKIGDRVRVTAPSGERATGLLTAVDPVSLSLDVGARSRTFTMSDLTRVEVRRRDSMLNGIVLGAGIGTVYGVWIDQYDDCDECHDTLWGSIVTGALIGLTIDAIKPAWRPAVLPPAATCRLRVGILPSSRSGAVATLTCG